MIKKPAAGENGLIPEHLSPPECSRRLFDVDTQDLGSPTRRVGTDPMETGSLKSSKRPFLFIPDRIPDRSDTDGNKQ